MEKKEFKVQKQVELNPNKQLSQLEIIEEPIKQLSKLQTQVEEEPNKQLFQTNTFKNIIWCFDESKFTSEEMRNKWFLEEEYGNFITFSNSVDCIEYFSKNKQKGIFLIISGT